MRFSWKAGIYPLVVAGWGGLCVYAGRLADVSLRDWRALLVLAGLLAGFFALLWLGPQDRELQYAVAKLECGMTGSDDEGPGVRAPGPRQE